MGISVCVCVSISFLLPFVNSSTTMQTTANDITAAQQEAKVLLNRLTTLVSDRWPTEQHKPSNNKKKQLHDVPTLEECGVKWGIVTRGKNLEICAYLKRQLTNQRYKHFFAENGSDGVILDKQPNKDGWFQIPPNEWMWWVGRTYTIVNTLNTNELFDSKDECEEVRQYLTEFCGGGGVATSA